MLWKIVGAALVASLSSLAVAGQYVGNTSSTYVDTAMPALYAACQADYGAGAYVCTTKELLESPTIAGETITAKWVRPYVVGGNDNYPMDYTGKIYGSDRQSCPGWGSILDSNLVLTQQLCANATEAVCCR